MVLQSSASELRRLIEKAQKGDKSSFETLYSECYAPLYRYVYMKLGGRTPVRHDSEDIVQDAFLRAWSTLDRMDVNSGSPMAYLYTIARNLVIDKARKKKEVLFPEGNEFDFISGDLQTPEEYAHQKEQGNILSDAMSLLSVEQREILVLRFMNGFSTDEIREITGKSAEAVRQLQSRALKALRYMFVKEESFDELKKVPIENDREHIQDK